jgi:acetyltransferase-like isoleucine patch superfamily enzyme
MARDLTLEAFVLRSLFHAILTQLERRHRRRLYRSLGELGKSVRIGKEAGIFWPERIKVGSNVLIHAGAYLDGEGGIRIGDNFVAARNLSILSSSHNFESPEQLPWDEGKVLREVVIEANVWVGLNVTIIPGVRVGEGAVIAAGAVVTKDVPACAVVGGNPARVLKYRDQARYAELKAAGRFRLHPATPTTSDALLP